MTQPPRACGIDFGTSNSTVGWVRPDAPSSSRLPPDAAAAWSAMAHRIGRALRMGVDEARLAPGAVPRLV